MKQQKLFMKVNRVALGAMVWNSENEIGKPSENSFGPKIISWRKTMIINVSKAKKRVVETKCNSWISFWRHIGSMHAASTRTQNSYTTRYDANFEEVSRFESSNKLTIIFAKIIKYTIQSPREFATRIQAMKKIDLRLYSMKPISNMDSGFPLIRSLALR